MKIETCIYHKEAIKRVLSILNQVKVTGFEEAQKLVEISNIIQHPLKEDILEWDLKEQEDKE